MASQAQFLRIERNEFEANTFTTPNVTSIEIPQTQSTKVYARRVFLFTNSIETSVELETQLARTGYEIILESITNAYDLVVYSPPDVALIELQCDEAGKSEGIKLARRLRAQPATLAVPLVFLFHDDSPTLRNLSLRAGADDYFSIHTSLKEMQARCEAIFWRAEAGRRIALQTSDQRLEIDNFISLLDSMRESAAKNETGTMALVEASSRGGSFSRELRDRTLAEAYGFLKLHLRRMDGVAYYGPTTLLVYLHGTDMEVAQTLLTSTRSEFLDERPESDLSIGMASFPMSGIDIEKLIERAEVRLAAARARGSQLRVVANETREKEDVARVADKTPENERTAGAPETLRKDSAGQNAARSFLMASQIVREKKIEAVENSLACVSSLYVGAENDKVDATARRAAEAARQERERRANGLPMPQRLLLAVSDPARLAQVNSLIRAAGYEVRAAFDGQQAIDLLRIECPDLLLIDYDLRDMNGVETLRRLRQQSGGRLKLPIALMLDVGDESAHGEALAIGAQAVVTLPYDPADLLRCVRTIGNVT